jgi:CheY-like chemotaxis protein
MGQAVQEQYQHKLLLIDDSEIVLATEVLLLSRAGFDVRAASSLRAFLELLREWRPHVVVTDLHMPEMSGAELCRWLRQEIATTRIPIVLCSSMAEPELARVARDIGADAYVSKNNGLDELPERLHALCDEIVW